jgi:hypothetical protein
MKFSSQRAPGKGRRQSSAGQSPEGMKRERKMATSSVKELYLSPNGDRWALARNGDGKLVVSHHPSRASGGQPSEIAVDVFLSHGGRGPEHLALTAALAELALAGKNPDHRKLDAKTTENVDRVLGQAVARCWSKLPPEIQHSLFEAAVQAGGETMRQELAVHLHDKHLRTAQSLQARAMPEPDSLGG